MTHTHVDAQPPISLYGSPDRSSRLPLCPYHAEELRVWTVSDPVARLIESHFFKEVVRPLLGSNPGEGTHANIYFTERTIEIYPQGQNPLAIFFALDGSVSVSWTPAAFSRLAPEDIFLYGIGKEVLDAANNVWNRCHQDHLQHLPPAQLSSAAHPHDQAAPGGDLIPRKEVEAAWREQNERFAEITRNMEKRQRAMEYQMEEMNTQMQEKDAHIGYLKDGIERTQREEEARRRQIEADMQDKQHRIENQNTVIAEQQRAINTLIIHDDRKTQFINEMDKLYQEKEKKAQEQIGELKVRNQEKDEQINELQQHIRFNENREEEKEKAKEISRKNRAWDRINAVADEFAPQPVGLTPAKKQAYLESDLSAPTLLIPTATLPQIQMPSEPLSSILIKQTLDCSRTMQENLAKMNEVLRTANRDALPKALPTQQLTQEIDKLTHVNVTNDNTAEAEKIVDSILEIITKNEAHFRGLPKEQLDQMNKELIDFQKKKITNSVPLNAPLATKLRETTMKIVQLSQNN